MLRIIDKNLNQQSLEHLALLQSRIDQLDAYDEQVKSAKKLWMGKNGTPDGRSTFQHVRAVLAKMCIGSTRCAYCEDSAADEVEHIFPKSLFPEKAFVWRNYSFACGPCNGPKGSQYALIRDGAFEEFVRGPRDPVVMPPQGLSALIDPRSEDPMKFLELDLGGVAAQGDLLQPTFEFLPAEDLDDVDELRARYTIRTLGLNREVLTVARGNAFNGFRARLFEYAEQRPNATAQRLLELKADFLRTPHLTVFHEMKRQRLSLPTIDALLHAAPEVLDWSLV